MLWLFCNEVLHLWFLKNCLGKFRLIIISLRVCVLTLSETVKYILLAINYSFKNGRWSGICPAMNKSMLSGLESTYVCAKCYSCKCTKWLSTNFVYCYLCRKFRLLYKTLAILFGASDWETSCWATVFFASYWGAMIFFSAKKNPFVKETATYTRLILSELW